MKLNRCDYCGSTNIKADRALAGKLFCLNCGRTLSNKSVKRFQTIRNNRTGKIWIYFLLLILILLIVIQFS